MEPEITPRDIVLEEAMQYYKTGKIEIAYQKLLRASLTHHNDVNVLSGLALCLAKLGRHEASAKQWAHLIRHAPAAYVGVNRLHHASALMECGRLEDAKTLLQSCGQLGNDAGFYLRLVRRLTELEQAGCNRASRGTDARSRDTIATEYRAEASDIVSANHALRTRYEGVTANTVGVSKSLSYKTVLIVTYGRTGSTLLQGMLNTIDGLSMLGENEGAFFDLFEYVSKVERITTRKDHSEPGSPFFSGGVIDQNAAKRTIQGVLDAYFAPARAARGVVCVGFKDVRYADRPDRLNAYLQFLEEMLDEPAFIFLCRDHDEVMRSGWWKKIDRIKAAANLQEFERQAQLFAKDRRNCFTLDYTDLTDISNRLARLFDFLGATMDVEKVSDILSIPHSYNPERPKIRDLFESAKNSGMN